MGAKVSMKEIKIINTMDSDINLSNRKLDKDKFKNLYKRDSIRRNAQSVKDNQHVNKITSRKNLMTKEQRNLLKSILKENVKENKKTIAKNLVGIFLESSKNNSKLKFKNQAKTNKIQTQEKKVNQTPKEKYIKKNEKSKKFSSNNSIKKAHRMSLVTTVHPSHFGKFKKQKEEAKNKENDNNKENIKQNNKVITEIEEDDTNEFGKIKSDGNDDNNNTNNDKISFTAFFKLQQEISQDNNKNVHKYSTPRGGFFQNNIEKKIELDEKKDLIFQRKSFREYVENNNRKDYNECLKFINSTLIISHLDESDKSLLIHSLKLKNFKKDECILKANEKYPILYFFKSGLLQFIIMKEHL